MPCAVHPDAEPVAKCWACEKSLCDECHAFDVDGQPACAACGADQRGTGEAIGGAQLAVTALGYLGFLAIAVSLFKPRPIVGGLGAIFAIAFGRAVAVFFKPRVVVRRRRVEA